MPYTVSKCFEVFRREVVDLDPGDTATARSSRDFVIENVEQLAKKGSLPRLFSGMSLNFGSFDRKTKKRELDDIDMMVCLSGIGGNYHTVMENKQYRITFDKSVPVIKECLEQDGNLNSRKVINLFISALSEVSQYKKAEMHRDHEAARLQLVSYPWNFDIVPCFYTVEGFYLIPDGNGNWKNTDPRIDRARVTEVNQGSDGIALPLIRLMKYWKKEAWGDAVLSYMFEQMVLNCVAEGKASVDTWQERVKNVLSYLKDAIQMPVPDPKGIQGDMNDVAPIDRIELSQKASRDASSAVMAIVAENLGQTKNAIAEWKNIFGDEFPDYGRD